MLKPKLISLAVADNERINILLFSEERQDRVIILVHGACMNFTTGICRFVPGLSTLSNKYDFITVNTRAHDLGYVENNFTKFRGWAWQRTDENLLDLGTVVKYAIDRGYEEVILCGHSWGGLISLDYVISSLEQSAPISKLILFSPTVSYHLLLEVNYRGNLIQILDKANELSLSDKLDTVIPTPMNSAIPFMSSKTIIDFNENSFSFDDAVKKCDLPLCFIVGGLEHKRLVGMCMNASALSTKYAIQCAVVKKANHHGNQFPEITFSRLDGSSKLSNMIWESGFFKCSFSLNSLTKLIASFLRILRFR